MRLGSGVTITGLMLVSLGEAVGPALEQCYVYQWHVRRDMSLYRVPLEMHTIAAYQATAPAGSILVSDVVLPLLTEAGMGQRHTIVPLTPGEYWGQAPLRNLPQVLDRQRILTQALRRGVPVYTDSLSVEPVRRHGPQDWERFLAVHRVQLQTVTTQGAVTIYQLVPTS